MNTKLLKWLRKKHPYKIRRSGETVFLTVAIPKKKNIITSRVIAETVEVYLTVIYYSNFPIFFNFYSVLYHEYRKRKRKIIFQRKLKEIQE